MYHSYLCQGLDYLSHTTSYIHEILTIPQYPSDKKATFSIFNGVTGTGQEDGSLTISDYLSKKKKRELSRLLSIIARIYGTHTHGLVSDPISLNGCVSIIYQLHFSAPTSWGATRSLLQRQMSNKISLVCNLHLSESSICCSF